MVHQRTLTTLIVGASAAMIALSAIAVMFLFRNPANLHWASFSTAWTIVLANGTATLLVMSLLHGDLGELYEALVFAEHQANQDARRDDLTGLGNRKFLYEQLELRAKGGGIGNHVALLLIDLDNFKQVNDTLGHKAGDLLITIAGKRIAESAPNAAIARLGGDEFALIVDLETPSDIEATCESLVARLNGNALLDEGERFISGSVGATFLSEGVTISELMRRADLAMYRAKSDGSGFRVYDRELSAEADRRSKLTKDLRGALEAGDLVAAFQSIVTPTRNIWAIEALVRWHHEEFGQIPPPEIISIAEDMRLVNEVSLAVVQQACKAAQACPGILISINLSAVQLMDDTFALALEDTVSDHDLEPDRFQLEIGEADFVDRRKAIATTLRHLRRVGFRIAVDDYGSASCSVSELQRLGVTTLKLDHRLLENAHETGSIAVIRSKVALAKSLGMVVVSEGIDNLDDEAAAIQAGCDYLQGFRYSRPVTLTGLLAAQTSTLERVAS